MSVTTVLTVHFASAAGCLHFSKTRCPVNVWIGGADHKTLPPTSGNEATVKSQGANPIREAKSFTKT